MPNDEELLTNLYNSFDPFQPLPAGDPLYVDCREVRGKGDIRVNLGNRIKRYRGKTCQLYAGHRGAGKSTELLRLKQFLEEKNFFVVFFGVDDEDINSEDAQYTDILLACTRHLLKELKDAAKPTPVLNWLKDRWEDLKDLAQTEVAFDKLTVDMQISQFAKLTANLRAEPTLRHQIRDKVNPYTVTLINVLNQFINDAKKSLPEGRSQLAVIVDNLDRIVPYYQESGRTNHEEIFIDRCEQLKAFDCHLVYTVPISMVYSPRSADLRDIYSEPQVLPMIMVENIDGSVCEPGFNKVKEVIAKRVGQFAADLSLENEIFDNPDTLKKLCLMSGGHVRNLLLLMQRAMDYTEELPISLDAVQLSVTDARDAYRRTVDEDQWGLLAEVGVSKQIRNEDKYRDLLFNRCVLEYCFFDEENKRQRWYDVHPLIREIREYREAVANI